MRCLDTKFRLSDMRFTCYIRHRVVREISDLLDDSVVRSVDIGLLVKGEPLPLKQVNLGAQITDMVGKSSQITDMVGSYLKLLTWSVSYLKLLTWSVSYLKSLTWLLSYLKSLTWSEVISNH